MGRAIAAIVLSCGLLAGQAAAQEGGHFPDQDGFSVTFQEGRGESGGTGKMIVRTKGLPPRTSVLLKLLLDEGEIPASWRRFLVGKSGLLTVEMGPYARKLLPGNYTVQLSVDRRQQDVTLDGVFSRWTRNVSTSYQWSYRSADAAEFRAKFKKQLTTILEGAVKLLDDVHTAGKAYRDGTQFHRGGRFDQVAFLKWADGVAQRHAEYSQQIRSLENTYLAPYWPQVVRFDIPNLLLNLRFVAIDYTIYPIHRRENLSVARRFQPMSGMMFKPSRASATSKVRSLAREITKTLEEKSGPEILTLLPPAENRPVGFAPVKLTGALAAMFSSNPGAKASPSEAAFKGVTARLGVSLSAEYVREAALMALAPEGKEDKVETVEYYVFRFKREFYGTMLVQMLARQRQQGKFKGQVLQREDLVGVVVGPTTPPHSSAVRSLANFLAQQKQFKFK